MSEEEKKAIENLKTDIRYSDLLTTYNDDIDTILNLIEKQEKTIKDLIKWRNYYKSLCKDIRKYKNKVIDEMAKTVYDYANLGTMGICPAEIENRCINFDLCEYFGKKDINCLKCVKLYFYRKVENNE